MPSLDEQEFELSHPMPINNPASVSHRSSIGSLDDAASSGSETEASIEKKPSSCGSSSSGVSSVASSPTTTTGNGLSEGRSTDVTSEFGIHMPIEHIAKQLGILSILDQPDDRKTITTTDDEATPIATTFVPKSYRSDSGASSGCDYSLEGGSPPLFGGQSFVPASYSYATGSITGFTPGIVGLAEYVDFPGSFDDQMPMRISGVNVTETVPVPSSEHVAEIVGRQGCKIKALRAKTNTYIKTPVRGEEPCFVVTGRRTDVEAAKLEIMNAADHFTQIRASRRHSQGGMPAPGHITAYVRVPYRVVGLVVGPKGATIKRIQQDTHTYIITPSRDREPVFEVTGMPENVEKARREIEMHIYMRTGNLPITNGYDASLHHLAAAQQHQLAAEQPQQGANAPGAPSAVAPDGWANMGMQSGPAQNLDFHLNGNDVTFNGEVPQIGSSVISKPSSAGSFGSFGAWGDSGTILPGSHRSAYPTWSTGGLVSVDHPTAFGFGKMESLKQLLVGGGKRTPMFASTPPNTPATVGIRGYS